MGDPVRLVDAARQRARTLYLAEVMGRRVTDFYEDLRAGLAPAAGETAPGGDTL
jgi:hypothetical protein